MMRHLIRWPDEDATGPFRKVSFNAGGDQAQNLLLQLLPVPGLVLIPYDQIHRQPLQSPIRMGLDQLADQLDTIGIGDLHQNNRQIAGNRMSPQARLATPV